MVVQSGKCDILKKEYTCYNLHCKNICTLLIFGVSNCTIIYQANIGMVNKNRWSNDSSFILHMIHRRGQRLKLGPLFSEIVIGHVPLLCQSPHGNVNFKRHHLVVDHLWERKRRYIWITNKSVNERLAWKIWKSKETTLALDIIWILLRRCLFTFEFF